MTHARLRGGVAGLSSAPRRRVDHLVGGSQQRLGESAPTPQVEADVNVRITPPVRPHGVDRKTDGIWIRGKRSGTAKAIHPVQRRLEKIMSRETRSVSDMPLGSVCACRAQREHRSNCRDYNRCPPLHWITSSAVANSVSGMMRPRALAVLRLMTSSNLVGRQTGRSEGLSPLRMRPE